MLLQVVLAQRLTNPALTPLTHAPLIHIPTCVGDADVLLQVVLAQRHPGGEAKGVGVVGELRTVVLQGLGVGRCRSQWCNTMRISRRTTKCIT